MKKRTYVEMLDTIALAIKGRWPTAKRSAYESLLPVLRKLDKERKK